MSRIQYPVSDIRYPTSLPPSSLGEPISQLLAISTLRRPVARCSASRFALPSPPCV